MSFQLTGEELRTARRFIGEYGDQRADRLRKAAASGKPDGHFRDATCLAIEDRWQANGSSVFAIPMFPLVHLRYDAAAAGAGYEQAGAERSPRDLELWERMEDTTSLASLRRLACSDTVELDGICGVFIFPLPAAEQLLVRDYQLGAQHAAGRLATLETVIR